MSDRYFVDEPISADRVTLSGPEAHHLIHVMRVTAGTRVTLFDGSGDEFSAVVERIGRADVELSVVSRATVNRELPFDVALGVALPKGDRQKWLVEKAVELGVTRIVPLRTQHGVAQPVEQALARLRRAVIEASKQCGRNRLLQIDEPRSWADFVADAAGTACRLVAQPGGKENAWQVAESVPQLRRSSVGADGPLGTACEQAVAHVVGHGDVYLAVGPEGGFADEEVALAVAAGWHTVDLGPRILRVETAALFLAAAIAGRATTPERGRLGRHGAASPPQMATSEPRAPAG
jgi:16S rRNA (uracil1498-N3)-methyltransferase